MKILLTGANGFIGSHLVKKLINLNHKLFVIKRQSSDLSRINQYISSIQLYNYEDTQVMSAIFNNKIDIIVHLAGIYIKNDSSIQDIHNINSFNIDTASQLAYLANNNSVKGFINTGTFFEYSLNSIEALNETSPIIPFNYYAASKVAFEQVLKYVCSTGNMKGITLKLFSPYGEKDNDKVIPLILKSFLKNKKLSLIDSSQKLSFTYIDDIVDAYVKSLEYIQSHEFKYDNFNIGSNTAYSIREIVDIVKTITSQSSPVQFGTTDILQQNSIKVLCDNSRAKNLLHWQPATTIKEGLKNTYEYYKKVI